MASTDIEQSTVSISKHQVKPESTAAISNQENFVALSVPNTVVVPDSDGSLADTNSRPCSQLSHDLKQSENEKEQTDKEDNAQLQNQNISDEDNRSLQENQEFHCIKVSGLDPQTSTDEIREYFEYYGKVKEIVHFNKLSQKQSNHHSGGDPVDAYVIFLGQSPIDDILKQENDPHVIRDHQVSLEVASDSDDIQKEIMI